MKILILMSTYNGEKYLQEQLDSLYRQTVPVDILVRDDGSTDGTQKILEENAKSGKLQWYTGENLRSAKSFWNLVHTAPQADYYAFCDQDDVWDSDKIERAIEKLQSIENQNQPLLYCSNVNVVDENLKPMYEDVVTDTNTEKKHTDFAHSLIYSLSPGCTMVFNDIARKYFLQYDMDKEFCIIHDWLAHKIVAMLGTVAYDGTPSMLYRQHGNNVIGAHKHGAFSIIRDIKRLMTSSAGLRSLNAKSLLSVYENILDDEKISLLNMVAYYKSNRKLKKSLLHDPVFSVRKKTDFLFRMLVRLNKI